MISSTPSPAYLLVFHGSHDPRSQVAAEALAESFRQTIQYVDQVPLALGQAHPAAGGGAASPWMGAIPEPDPGDWEKGAPTAIVQTAFLECHPQPLHQQIETFARLVHAKQTHSCQTPLPVVVIPVFLLPGVHVMEDVPTEIALAQQALGTTVDIRITPYLGTHPGLSRLITEGTALLPMEAWILLAHGSRRPGGNQPIEGLANRLGAAPAYWSIAPSLEMRLQELIDLGFRRIGVIPYVLFSGGITDAIAQTLSQFSQQHPELQLTLTNPLNARPELANLLIDLATQPSVSENGKFC